jgi:hypothetical protein
MWHTSEVHVTPGLKFYIMELMHALALPIVLSFSKTYVVSEGLSVSVIGKISVEIY